MDSVLMVVTVASLAAAGAAGWYALRLRRDERRRSDARVSALSTAIDAAGSGLRVPRAGRPPVPVSSLFAPEHSAAAQGVPVIRIAIGVAMGLALLVAVAMSNRNAAVESTGDAAVPRPASTREASSAPLELISMRHEREGTTLRVSGLVRNPRSGGPVSRVSAVVFAFNRAGAFVASARAALDFTTLEPGDESPFVVTIPKVPDVGKYRVSFRTEAGVVQHLDRRGDQTRLAAAR
jgi:hypothetical protein